MEIIIGWTIYKIYWEKLGTKDTLIVSNEQYLEQRLDDMSRAGYKITGIDFIYTRED